MHHPRSINHIYRFRLAAVLWCARSFFLGAAFVLMLAGLIVYDLHLTYIGGGAALAGGALAILQWMVASRAGCTLCKTPVLGNQACSRHRQAKTVFGSYHARVALSIIFKNHFYCPYCNEPTSCC